MSLPTPISHQAHLNSTSLVNDTPHLLVFQSFHFSSLLVQHCHQRYHNHQTCIQQRHRQPPDTTSKDVVSFSNPPEYVYRPRSSRGLVCSSQTFSCHSCCLHCGQRAVQRLVQQVRHGVNQASSQGSEGVARRTKGPPSRQTTEEAIQSAIRLATARPINSTSSPSAGSIDPSYESSSCNAICPVLTYP